MDFDRHRTEIVAQTELLTTELKDADLRAPVPSCPGWTLGMLVRHIGGGHRWAEEIARTRATGFLPDDQVRKLHGDDTRPMPVDWLLEGAARLRDTLGEAGPEAEVWAPFHYRSMSFWARRFTHETAMHRADATLAAGAPFRLAQDVALDTMDEWMELDVLPAHFDITPGKRELLGPGRTIALAATDAGTSWFVDLTGEVIHWHRGGGAAAVTVRASITDLLLVIYGRKPASAAEVLGDRELLDFWLRHVTFG
ncbi:MAG TPA: maleylpyruvate isomerase family mycothiol-dependent enzyme [Amycolatopsis sp.]|nr:maleylpyruvate isomerase family mycothiol-dependent enzyme [Amycolatopsis sp.]